MMHAIAITSDLVTLYRHDWAHQYQRNQLGECARAVFYSLRRPMGAMPHPPQPEAMARIKASEVHKLVPIDPGQDTVYSLAEQTKEADQELSAALAAFDPFPEWLSLNPGSLGALLRFALALSQIRPDKHSDPEMQLETIARYDRRLCLAQGFTCGKLSGWAYSLAPADAFDLADLPWEHLRTCAAAFLARYPGATLWT